MAVYTNDLRLKEIATGDEAGTWGTSTNTNLELVAEAFSFGTEAITSNADTHTTTIADGATDPGRSIYLQYTGTLDSTCTITIGPNTVSKLWFIENATSGSQDIIIKQGSGATVTVPNGQVKAIYSDGAGSGGKMVDAFTDLHVGGSFFVTTSSQDTGITVECTNGGSSAGPSLKLDRNSASPADSDGIGEIEFSGRNDASETIQYARIFAAIIDASDGTEDAKLEIDSIVNGTNRSRIEMSSTETVLNQDSQDLDFRVETDTDANALFVQGSTNRLMLGFNANVAVANVNPHLTVVGTDNGSGTLSSVRYSADAAGPRFVLSKSRNGSITTAGGTVVQSGDTTGMIQFCGDDGSDMASRTARIQSLVAATPGSDDMPGVLQFMTTADGNASESEHMRITDAGNIGIGDSAPSAKLHVTTSVQGDDAVVFESTNSGTSFGPALNLDRNSSSPADNDLLGRIIFNGRNDASEVVPYARIKSAALDVTDGEEDGKLELSTILAGADTSRMEMTITETVFNEDSKDLDFRIESNGSTKKFFVDGGENVVCINTDSPRGIASATNRQFQMEGTSGVTSSFSITRNQSSNGGPGLFFGKTRGDDFGAVTIVQDGDSLGGIGFAAADGTDVAHQAANISAEVDGTPGANDVPGRLIFKTTPDGSTTLNERMRINEGGDLLINTTTDYGGKVNIARADNSTQLALVSTDADASVGPRLDMIRDSSSPAADDSIGGIRFMGDDSGGTSISYVNFSAILEDPTDGSEDGSFKIETRTNSTLRDRINMTSTETIMNSEGVDLDFRVESDGSTHCLFVNAGTNKVGIKTSSPDGQLHIHTASAGSVAAGSAADELVLENSTSGGLSILTPNDASASIMFGDPEDNNVGMIQYVHNDDSMRFTVGASEAARIISDVLCVGTTTTVADDMTARACHIASNATTTGPSLIVDDSDTSVESGSICMAVMFSNDNSFSAAKYVSFRDIGGEQGSITGDGTGSVAYNTSSDMRLKTNIQDTASQWDTIKALQVRDYEWIGNGNEETGFIAQEIHEQIPQVVYVGGEEAAKEPWAVDYGRITPQLTKALQEAMARIETLESELAKLKGGS
jgi:hypothetical protein